MHVGLLPLQIPWPQAGHVCEDACVLLLAIVHLSALAGVSPPGETGTRGEQDVFRPHSDCGTCRLERGWPCSRAPAARGCPRGGMTQGAVGNWLLAGHGGPWSQSRKRCPRGGARGRLVCLPLQVLPTGSLVGLLRTQAPWGRPPPPSPPLPAATCSSCSSPDQHHTHGPPS